MNNQCELPMVSVEEAQQIVLDSVNRLGAQRVPLLDAVGRVLAEDVVSDIDITPFNNAAMDGFALKSADIEGATKESPIEVDVIDEVPAGAYFEGTLQAGQAVRIMTGAPVPASADTVVKYEIVDYLGGTGRAGTRVAFSEPSPVNKNIRMAGEEVAAGQAGLHAGDVLKCAGAGLAAECGAVEVSVFKKPRVGVIALGSELVGPETVPQKGQIRDGNSFALAASIAAAGALPVIMPVVADDAAAIEAALLSAVGECDFVITSGGASNGDYDHIKDVVSSVGQLKLTLMNMKPGKAVTFGLVEGVPVLGVPGNPAAALCVFEMLARPALLKMQGYLQVFRTTVQAVLGKRCKKKDTRRTFVRALLERNDKGDLVATPVGSQSSGVFGALQAAGCLLVLPEGVREQGYVDEGTPVECIPFGVEEGVVL